MHSRLQNLQKKTTGLHKEDMAPVATSLERSSSPEAGVYHPGKTVTIGGLPIEVINRDQAARVMLEWSRKHERGHRPLYFTSANGEVIARANRDEKIAGLFRAADQIVADGQPMVFASRWLCKTALPERVATTDLFHDVARRAEKTGHSFYMLGASPEQNLKAVQNVQKAYPKLNIVGHHHGFLRGQALDDKLAEINRLQPDILWLAMGVPAEQVFIREHGHQLSQVGLIKTSGGLFDFLSGKNPRAPGWMQDAGLEWAFRMFNEPRRLMWRYLSTNPKAMYFMVTKSS